MSSAQLTFRAVGPDDMSTMLSMAHQVSIHVESERHFAGTAETFNRAFGFSHEGTPGSGFVSGFVAEYDGQIAGGAIYFDHFNAWKPKTGLFLDTLYVNPEFRQKGIGKAMMRHLAKIAKSRNQEYIEWTCAKNNISAQEMYAAIGSETCEELLCLRLQGESFNKFAMA